MKIEEIFDKTYDILTKFDPFYPDSRGPVITTQIPIARDFLKGFIHDDQVDIVLNSIMTYVFYVYKNQDVKHNFTYDKKDYDKEIYKNLCEMIKEKIIDKTINVKGETK